MTEPMEAGDVAVVTEDWVYDCPKCPEVLSAKAGDTFTIYAYVSEWWSDSGFAFYRGTVEEDGKVIEYLCPADKCERKTNG